MPYYYPDGRLTQRTKQFSLETNIPVTTFSLGGTWNIMPEYSNGSKKRSS